MTKFNAKRKTSKNKFSLLHRPCKILVSMKLDDPTYIVEMHMYIIFIKFFCHFEIDGRGEYVHSELN
jgi:hypothetical protein